jgi:SAM-dependent methyltransferase
MRWRQVISTDCAADMVAQATARAAAVPNVQCRVADATDLSAFPDASVDAVTCCYGLMFPADKARALAEIHRVLKPGGTCVATYWKELDVVNLGRAVMGAVMGAPPLDPGRICSAQLMLSKFEYDGVLNPRFAGDGEFSLPIARIAFYGSAPASAKASGADAATWVHVSSAGVTRPDRPGIDVSVEPPAVRMNAELGGLLTHKLAGEDAVRAARLRHVIVRPVALTEEPRGAELQVSQGDVIKGKISRDDVAECVVAAVQGRAGPAVLGSTFELKSTVPFSQPWTAEDAAKAPPSRDWAALLADVRPGVTGKTVNGVYTGTAPEAEAVAAR